MKKKSEKGTYAWFQLCDIQEKAKLCKQEKRSVVTKGSGRMRGRDEYVEDF
jgi:hypothetical protein